MVHCTTHTLFREILDQAFFSVQFHTHLYFPSSHLCLDLLIQPAVSKIEERIFPNNRGWFVHAAAAKRT